MKARPGIEELIKERTGELSDAYELLKSEMDQRCKAQRDIFEISEREQKRIGQDLHDGLAQQLSGISFMCKTLQYKLAEKSLPEEKDVVQILDFLKAAIAETRRVSRRFYPLELEKLGLLPALEELVISKQEKYGIPCRYQFDHSVEIPNDVVAKHVYRIAHEAISNAVKHGKPTRVNLSVKRVDGDVVLTVEDNSIGIDKNQLAAQQMGIEIMEYHAKMAGGAFNIENQNKGGTRVTFTFQPDISHGASHE